MLIDFHVHAFPDKIAAHAIGALSQNSGYVPESNGTFSDTVDKMRAGGVDKFVLLNVAQTPSQQHNANSFVIEKTAQRCFLLPPFIRWQRTRFMNSTAPRRQG